MVAALLFGAAEALQLRAQLLPVGVPLQFLIMLPYVLTIVVLAVSATRSGEPGSAGATLRKGWGRNLTRPRGMWAIAATQRCEDADIR